jgi:class II lanthipeptide synthase
MTSILGSEAALAAAERIAEEIAASAVWMEDRCNWIGAMPEEGSGGRTTMSYRALGPDLYGGSAGVGLFLAETAVATGREDLRHTALGALRHAISRAGSVHEVSSAGLYAGTPGIALALALCARALEEPQLAGAARRLAVGTPEPLPGAELDLMSGSAGAIVGLLTLRSLLNDPASAPADASASLDTDPLLDASVLHGDALLGRAEHAGAGICWRSQAMPGAPGLTGLSHGAAGVAVALLELAAATGDERYRTAAEAAFDYERALYDEAVCNWPDLRSTSAADPGGAADTAPNQTMFATFWCHGAPGGALARLRALELGMDGGLREEALAALATTETWVATALASGTVNYSLCHGLAGNAEILLEGGSLSERGTALAERVALAGIDIYHEHGRPWPSGAYGGATPCLLLGLAGIGRFYLRLARELPSILIVRTQTTTESVCRSGGAQPSPRP